MTIEDSQTRSVPHPAQPDQPQAAAAATADFVDVDAWDRLSNAGDQTSFGAAWLDLQCRLIGDVVRAVLVLPDDSGGLSPRSWWQPPGVLSPADVAPVPVAAALMAVAELAVEQRRGAVRRRAGDGVADAAAACDVYAWPVLADDKVRAVVALEVKRLDEARMRLVMRLLQWGAAWWQPWLDDAAEGGPPAAGGPGAGELTAVLGVLVNAMEANDLDGAATASVTELSLVFDCERVSYGSRPGRHVRVHALSHAADFNKKSSLLRDIGAAMDEAMDQQSTLVLPEPNPEPEPASGQSEAPPQASPNGAGGAYGIAAVAVASGLATHALRKLSEQHAARAICVLPLSDAGRIVGALCLERESAHPFDAGERALAEHAAVLLGPVLEAKRREQRWIGTKNWDALMGVLRRMLGPGHLLLKTVAIGLLALGIFLATASGPYRINAPAVLEGSVQRAVTAPLDGFVSAAEVRPGDLVRSEQVLARLEDKDLRLEQAKWDAERAKLSREYSQAIAERDRARMRILGAQMDQAEARADLLSEQLARTTLRAPFDGVVVSGDLSQAIGAPVSRGELLFELAPLDDYRVVLNVDERDIGRVAVGLRGRIALSALPNTALPIEVVKLTPVAQAEEGSNRFRVEGRLLNEAASSGADAITREQMPVAAQADGGAYPTVVDGATLALLRPGMRGIGKLDLGERSLFWIWTHRLQHWLRLQWWTWAG